MYTCMDAVGGRQGADSVVSAAGEILNIYAVRWIFIQKSDNYSCVFIPKILVNLCNIFLFFEKNHDQFRKLGKLKTFWLEKYSSFLEKCTKPHF